MSRPLLSAWNSPLRLCFPLVALLGFALLYGPLRAQQNGYEALKSQAENLYNDHSYALARAAYQNIDTAKLSPEQKRWVAFRLADTQWRSQAGTQNPDPSQYEQARKQLDLLVRDVTRVEDRDRLWAEVQESLGASWWLPRDTRNWGAAWPFYQNALDWWAGSPDLDAARERYLHLLFELAEPPIDPTDYYVYGTYGNYIPLEMLRNALKIARSEDDRAHLHYLVAVTLQNQGDANQRLLIEEEFEAALKGGKSNSWYDDALYQYAQWMANNGPVKVAEDGGMTQTPDYVRALALYRRITGEFKKGETRYFDQAKQEIENITRPTVSVGVANVFLPRSEIRYSLSWRNVKSIGLALYPVDLAGDVKLTGPNVNSYEWLQSIDLTKRPKARSWTETVKSEGHVPGQKTVFLKEKLPLGAYVLEASGEGKTARDLVLVSDTALVVKTAGTKALAYLGETSNGKPRPGAKVHLWQRYYTHDESKRKSGDSGWYWRDEVKTANDQGIAIFDLADTDNHVEVFVGANGDGHQAFNDGSYYNARYRPNVNGPQTWRIYAFTDRPAYRPNETAQWKFIARHYDGSVYTTPNGQTLEYEINDPRGNSVKKGSVKLNAFGSAWGSLALTENMPLGEYRITFWNEGRKHHIGNAMLLRLEEYKLPEFKVSVQTPEEKDRKKTYLMGEKVEVEVRADYYFGGPVGEASVELVVYQNPFYHTWFPKRDYPWFYSDASYNPYGYYGEGQVVKRETLRTDAKGKATLVLDTPRGSGQDFEYRVEARVTDSSRREITATGKVRVTRQEYYVHPRPRHFLYRPGDTATIDLTTLDANSRPIPAEGTVRVTRDTWYEVWIDPRGKEVKGEQIHLIRAKYGAFPPPLPNPRGPGWRLKTQGYRHTEILTQKVRTDSEGKAAFAFTPDKEGYYTLTWGSRDRAGHSVQASAAVWACTNRTTELFYRAGGLEIVADRDTFQAGETARLILNTPLADRYVLFSVEADDLYSTQLVHVTGTSQMVTIPVGERHVPNVFLNAVMFSDHQIYQDNEEIVVPPVRQFLKVDVAADREEYRPRGHGVLTVSTKDFKGNPVSAEVALGLVDESVYYIQDDPAGDVRQFFYGTKRVQQVQTQSTLNRKSYLRLEKERKKDRSRAGERAEDRDANNLGYNMPSGGSFGGGGFGGGAYANRSAGMTPMAPAPLGTASSAAATMAVTDSVAELNGPVAAKAVMPAPFIPPTGDGPAVVVRNDFRTTVFWQPDVVTDREGKATVNVTYPDTTTGWKATARVAGSDNSFGIGDGSTRTKQPLIVRLQAPRFFVAGDTVTVSAVINNNTDGPLTVRPSLKADGVSIIGEDSRDRNAAGMTLPAVNVPAGGETRADWQVAAQNAGTAKLTTEARATTGDLSDAMEREYAIYEHGIDKLVARSGKMRGDGVTVKLDLPKERKAGSTALTVQVAPSMATTMLDALPYLIDYPYGCTEQTMSRFLPAAITAKTLRDLGIAPETAMGRIFGGIETDSAGKNHPGGKKDLEKLDEMVRQGLARLFDFQHEDGGWGWWKEGESDPYMTAYVVWGLTLARDAGIDVGVNSHLERGVIYLDQEIVEEEKNVDLQAWMLYALASYHASNDPEHVSPSQAKALENLWTNRDRLTAYTRALLALSAKNFGDEAEAKTLVQNLVNGVKVDQTPDTSVVMEGPQSTDPSVMGTAHWGSDGFWWRWSEGGIESTAFVLKAILAIDPDNALVEPVTNWLIQNRRGAQWTNTRDTTITILALNDYLKKSGELGADMAYEVNVNGHPVAAKKLSAGDALSAPSRFPVDPAFVRDGSNDVQIRRTGGSGPLYFAAEARFFSTEEPVKPAGNQIFVRRQYFRRVGRPTLLKGYVYENVPLNDGDRIVSGDRVECLITVEAKNDYEYLLFEDLKPAGLEAVEVKSGESLYARQLKATAIGTKFGEEVGKPGTVAERPQSTDESDYTGQNRWVYQELRDRKTAMFLDKLPEGVWEIRYDLRAEVPGQFHALPVVAQAMYVPEIRANGTEVRLTVADRE